MTREQLEAIAKERLQSISNAIGDVEFDQLVASISAFGIAAHDAGIEAARLVVDQIEVPNYNLDRTEVTQSLDDAQTAIRALKLGGKS